MKRKQRNNWARRQDVLWAFFILGVVFYIACFPEAVLAQEKYPNKPIQIIENFPAGADYMALAEIKGLS